MQFDYQVHGAGWATATVRDSGREVVMTASYLHDSLAQLVEAVLALLAGEAESSVVFMAEPGEHHLVFSNTPHGEVTIQARWFNDWASWKMYPAHQYRVVLECRSTLAEVREQITAALQRILDAHGLEGYREQWGEHAFPAQLYQQLLCG